MPESAPTAFYEADTVMLISYDSTAMWTDEGYENSVRGINFTVEKVYKGSMKQGEKTILAFGKKFKNDTNWKMRVPRPKEGVLMRSSCTLTFRKEFVGRQILFYGEKPKDGEDWMASVCSGTALAEERPGDIAWLDRMQEVKGKTRISGRAVIPVESQYRTPPLPVAGAKIRITAITGGRKSYNLVTDKNGLYEIYDLPTDTYSIEAFPPKGFEIRESSIYIDPPPDAKMSKEKMNSHLEFRRAMETQYRSLPTDSPRGIMIYPGGHSGVNFYFKEKK